MVIVWSCSERPCPSADQQSRLLSKLSLMTTHWNNASANLFTVVQRLVNGLSSNPVSAVFEPQPWEGWQWQWQRW
jgi:hypothetical protein